MNRFLIVLLLLVLFPVIGLAQDDTTIALDEYVEELNAMCPIYDEDEWSLNSLTAVEDRYILVDVKLPATLSMVLKMLTGEGDDVKRLWIRQMSQYGDRWNHMVDLFLDSDRRIVLYLRPEGTDKPAFITLFPSDFSGK